MACPESTDCTFRAGGPSSTSDLGLLGKLPGTWRGDGFNLIARPARLGNPKNPIFCLELNGTKETLEFKAIGGAIPNRGDIEPTACLHAMTYLQSVTDCATNTGIHKEPGLWVHVPKTAENASETYVRQASIPHGDSLLAQSTFFTTLPNAGPTINPVNSFPFPIADPIPGLNDNPAHPLGSPYTDQYTQDKLPTKCLPSPLVDAATIKDPTRVLQAAIDTQAKKGYKFKQTEVIAISTAPVGGIVNIPFVVKNANAVQMDAIFWIEWMVHPSGSEFFQLQYVQRVILNFENIHWPHISVATLIKE